MKSCKGRTNREMQKTSLKMLSVLWEGRRLFFDSLYSIFQVSFALLNQCYVCPQPQTWICFRQSIEQVLQFFMINRKTFSYFFLCFCANNCFFLCLNEERPQTLWIGKQWCNFIHFRSSLSQKEKKRIPSEWIVSINMLNHVLFNTMDWLVKVKYLKKEFCQKKNWV